MLIQGTSQSLLFKINSFCSFSLLVFPLHIDYTFCSCIFCFFQSFYLFIFCFLVWRFLSVVIASGSEILSSGVSSALISPLQDSAFLLPIFFISFYRVLTSLISLWFFFGISVSRLCYSSVFPCCVFYSLALLELFIIVVLNQRSNNSSILLYLTLVHVLALSLQLWFLPFSMSYNFFVIIRHDVLGKRLCCQQECDG